MNFGLGQGKVLTNWFSRAARAPQCRAGGEGVSKRQQRVRVRVRVVRIEEWRSVLTRSTFGSDEFAMLSLKYGL